MTPATGSASGRAARAAVIAGLAVGCSLMAHGAAGGHLAPAAGLLVTGLVVIGSCLPAVQWASTAPRVATLLAGLQVLTHVSQTLAASASVSASATTTLTLPHLRHGAAVARRAAGDTTLPLTAPAAGSPLSHVHSGTHLAAGHAAATMDTSLLGLLPSAGMLVAHVIAAALVAALLVSGERSWAAARQLICDVVPGRMRALLTAVGLQSRLASLVRLPRETSPMRWAIVFTRGPGVDLWSGRGPTRRGPPALTL